MARDVRYWRLVSKDWRFGSDLMASWYEFRSWVKVSFEIDGVLPDEDGVVGVVGVVGLRFEDCMQPIVCSPMGVGFVWMRELGWDILKTRTGKGVNCVWCGGVEWE